MPCLLTVIACRDQDPQSLVTDRSGRGFIAFVGAGPGNALWPVLRASGRRYLQTGSLLDIRFFNSLSDAPQAQVDLLNSLNDPDMRGVCVQINSVDDSLPVLSRLQNRGIMIVTMIESAGAQSRLTHVGLDDTKVGEALARCIAEIAEPPGDKGRTTTIMVLHAGDKHPVYGPRHLAFMDALRRNSKVEVLADLNCGGDPREARRIIKERAARYPRLDLWVAMDDWPLENDTPAREVFGPGPHYVTRYITVGGFPRHWPLIRSGLCPCVVAADYGDLAGKAAQFCTSIVREPMQERRDLHVPLRMVIASDRYKNLDKSKNLDPYVDLDQYIRDWSSWAGTPVPGP